jgi:hypothetical protein
MREKGGGETIDLKCVHLVSSFFLNGTERAKAAKSRQMDTRTHVHTLFLFMSKNAFMFPKTRRKNDNWGGRRG